MSKKKPNDDSNSHVKYTKYGYPYIDVDEFFASERGKELDKRMKIVGDILKAKSKSNKTKENSSSN